MSKARAWVLPQAHAMMGDVALMGSRIPTDAPFDLLDLLGRGAMGSVWRARVRGVEAAVKTLRLRQEDDAAATWDGLESEVRAMARLDHPGIVRVYDYGRLQVDVVSASGERSPAGTPYFVMELASGGRLRSRHLPTDWRGMVRLLARLLEALAHAHARGVIHRDLKPGNILMEGVRPKLADFGLAAARQRSERELVATPLLGGTPGFMAPEQIRGEIHDEGPWTDLYALGCLAYEILDGRPPLRGASTQQTLRLHCAAPRPALEPRFPMPEGIERWVHRLMARSPHRRYRFAADALLALRALDGDERASTTELPASLDSTETVLDRPGLDQPRLDRPGLDQPRLDRPGLAERVPSVNTRVRIVGARELPPTPARDLRFTAVGPHGLGHGTFGLRTLPLAGRERERRWLWTHLQAVAKGRMPRVLLLSGSAGIGKTRLVSWLAESAIESGAAQVLWSGHAPEPHPMDGLAGWVHSILPSRGESRGELLRRLEATPLGASLSAAEREQLLGAPAAQADRFASFRALFSRMGRDRPVIAVVEDVQRSAETLAFLDFVIRTRDHTPLPLLVVATRRRDDSAETRSAAERIEALRARQGVDASELRPLTLEEHQRLVGELLGLDPELATTVTTRTLGNPLFAIQLVGELVHRGALERGERGFSLRAGERLQLPADVHTLWTERLSRLADALAPAEHVEQALFAAAVLGREVERTEWERACHHAGVTVHPRLVDELAKRRLARVDAGRLELEHSMFVDSLRQRARERGAWERTHRACAEALHEMHEDQPLFAEQIGRHLFEAGAAGEALSPLLAGASYRYDRAEWNEARDVTALHQRALDVLGVGPGDPRRAESLLLEAACLIRVSRFAEAQVPLEQARHAAEHSSPDVLARWLYHRGRVLIPDAPTEAVPVLERSLGLHRRAGSRLGVARCLVSLATTLVVLGRAEEAEAHCREALSLYAEERASEEVVYAWLRLSSALRLRGDAEAAAEAAVRSIARSREVGNRHALGVGLNELGDIARSLGDFRAAVGHYRNAAEEWEAVAADFDVSIARLNVGLALLQSGSFEAAKRELQSSYERFRNEGATPLLRIASSGLASCAAWRGDAQRYDQHYGEVAPGDVDFCADEIAWIFEHAAEAWVQRGDLERAERAYGLSEAKWRLVGREDRVAAIEAQRALMAERAGSETG